MNLLKSKTVWYAIIIAVLSIVQGYIGLLPMTPVALKLEPGLVRVTPLS